MEIQQDCSEDLYGKQGLGGELRHLHQGPLCNERPHGDAWGGGERGQGNGWRFSRIVLKVYTESKAWAVNFAICTTGSCVTGGCTGMPGVRGRKSRGQWVEKRVFQSKILAGTLPVTPCALRQSHTSPHTAVQACSPHPTPLSRPAQAKWCTATS